LIEKSALNYPQDDEQKRKNNKEPLEHTRELIAIKFN
jgi:hypothetical protein